MTDQLRLYHDPLVLRHGTGAFHPEGPERVAAVVSALEAGGFAMHRPPSPERTRSSISLVHDPAYVERFREAASLGPDEADRPFTLFDSPDNPMSRSTFDVAERTVGLLLAAVDDVMTGAATARFRRHATARAPRPGGGGDGLLLLQRRGRGGPGRPAAARRRAGPGGGLRRPPRERDAGDVLGGRQRRVPVGSPVPLLPGDRGPWTRRGPDRGSA